MQSEEPTPAHGHHTGRLAAGAAGHFEEPTPPHGHHTGRLAAGAPGHFEEPTPPHGHHTGRLNAPVVGPTGSFPAPQLTPPMGTPAHHTGSFTPPAGFNPNATGAFSPGGFNPNATGAFTPPGAQGGSALPAHLTGAFNVNQLQQPQHTTGSFNALGAQPNAPAQAPLPAHLTGAFDVNALRAQMGQPGHTTSPNMAVPQLKQGPPTEATNDMRFSYGVWGAVFGAVFGIGLGMLNTALEETSFDGGLKQMIVITVLLMTLSGGLGAGAPLVVRSFFVQMGIIDE